MQWSQLKKRIESNFAPSLAGRLELRLTVYRTLTEGDGRAWVTLDGDQIYSMEDMPSREKMRARSALWESAGLAAQETPATGSFFSSRDFLGALHDYLRTDFDALLNSQWPLYRALAMADRRLGKRRFEKLSPDFVAHPFVHIMYETRRAAEGWPAA